MPIPKPKYKIIIGATYTNKKTGEEIEIPKTSPEQLEQKLIRLINNDRDAPESDKKKALSLLGPRIRTAVKQANDHIASGGDPTSLSPPKIVAIVILILFMLAADHLAG